ncbi:MAG TPA: GAF domain-containing protein [Dehalococcoidia bacterium]|nr:GAF domain-containing protein [Dehalococcoidia bacterium]
MLRAKETQQARHLHVLYDLAIQTAQAEDLRAIYSASIAALRRGLGVDFASVLLFDEDGVIRFKAWHGLSSEYRAATSGHSPWTPDAADPQPILVPDVMKDPSLKSLRPIIVGEGIRALGFFPLVARGRLLGKFMIYYRQPHDFPEDDLQLAEMIAGQVAVAIDRTRQEDALRTSEELFSKAFHASPMGLSIVRAGDRTFVDINEAFLSLLGYERDEVIGKDAMSLGIWGNEHDRLQVVDALSQGQLVRAAETQLVTRSGELRNVIGSMEIMDIGGETCVLAILADVTKRKQAEETLAFQRALLQAQSEAALEGILVVSPDGEMISFNQRFVEMCGIPDEVIASRSDAAAIQSVLEKLVDPDSFTAKIEYLYAHPEEQSIDELHLLDGRTFERHSRPLTGSEGELYGRVWYLNDVTEQQQITARVTLLADAGTMLVSSLVDADILSGLARVVVRGFADIFWVHEVEGGAIRRLAFAHAQPEQTEPYINVEPLHHTPATDHPVLRVARTMTPEKHGEMPEEMLATAARNPEHFDLLKAMGIRAAMIVPIIRSGLGTGTLTFALKRAGVFQEPDLQLATDLASRVGVALENARLYQQSLAMQEELRLAAESKDEFLGMVSHELRTPVTTLYGSARILATRGEMLSAEDRQDLSNDLQRESERLARLIEDLLVLARVELGEELLTEPVLVQAAMTHQVAFLKRRRPMRKVRVAGIATLPPAMGSPTYLEQVLRNLLDNADKYSPSGGTIHVRARHADGFVTIAIASGGAPVTSEEAARLFERFYRGEETPMHASGIGIGLTVCRRLIEAQSGTIKATPRRGGGLTVTFKLPACPD